jgi:hypothetical protein
VSTVLAVVVAVVGALVAVVAVLRELYWLIPVGIAGIFAGFLLYIRYRQHTPIYTGKGGNRP